MTHVVMIGQMGAGKTTVGRLIAEHMDRPLIDSDRQIQELTGRTGREIALKEGVPKLHRLELVVLLDALNEREPSVIAAAASVVDDRRGRDALRPPFCIWVDREGEPSSPEGHRRAAAPAEGLESRRPAFESLADITLRGEGDPLQYATRAIAHISSAH